MNKKTIRIAGWALGLSMAVAGIGAVAGASRGGPIETKAADATMAAGSNASACTVNSKAGIKVGTSSKSGTMTITVGAGASVLHLYIAGWSGASGSLVSIEGATASPSEITLVADSGVSGSGTSYTLSGSEASYAYDIDLSGIDKETVITLSASKRFVVWGATYEEKSAKDWTYSDIVLETKDGFANEYYVGDELDTAHLTVTYVEYSATLDDTRETDVTALATFNFDSSSVNIFNLSATYNEHTTDDILSIRIVSRPAGITFGSASGSLAIDKASVSGDDSYGNEWTVVSTGTTSWTQNAAYSQVGSGSKRATSATFTMNFDGPMNVTTFSAKFGAFSGDKGAISVTLDGSEIASGSLNGTTDVVVSSTAMARGTSLIVTLTDSSLRFKAYYINYMAKTDVELLNEFATMYLHMNDYDSGGDIGSTGGNGACLSYYADARTYFNSTLLDTHRELFCTSATYADARNRLSEWARINGDSLDFETTYKIVISPSQTVNPISDLSNERTQTAVIAIAAGTVLAAGGFLLIQRKRRDQE